MSCKIDPKEFPIGTVRDLVNSKKLSTFKASSEDTFESINNKVKIFQNIVTSELVDNTKLVKGYHLDPSGKTSRYVWVDNKNLAFAGRVTDANSARFKRRKGFKAAAELSNLPDNERKRMLGTKVHKALQDLTYYYMKLKPAMLANDLSTIPDVKLSDIQSELGLTDSEFAGLQSGFLEIFKLIKDTQTKIDPNGKVSINPESFIPDVLTAAKGGTTDLFVLYSDKTGSLFDYKTMSGMVGQDGKLADASWIPDYKMEEFNLQLPTLVEMYKNIGVKEFRHVRVVPILIKLKNKAKNDTTKVKGNTLTDTIQMIKMGKEADKYLSHIPITIEDTGNKSLNKSINEALKLRHNLTKRLGKYSDDSAEYISLMSRIRNLTASINSIMLDKDIRSTFKQYRSIVDRYLADNNVLREGTLLKDSPLFLTNQKIEALLADIDIFESIAASTPEFIDSLKVDDEEVNKEKYLNTLTILVGRTSMLRKALQERLITLNLSTDEVQAMLNDKNLTFFDRYLRRFSNIQNTIFQKVRNLIDTANNRSRLSLQEFTSQLKKIDGRVQTWGESKGLSGFKVYEVFINKQTGNLHTKFKKELYEKLKLARKERDFKTLNKYVKLKDDASVTYQNKRQEYIIKHSLVGDALTTDTDFLAWERANNPELSTSEVKYANYWYLYYDINESAIEDELYNADFLTIKNTPELLEYYKFWTSNMEKFRKYLDLSGDRLPKQFVPWIKASIVEQYLANNISFSMESFKNLLGLNENNDLTFSDSYQEIRTEIDVDTGKPKLEIPKYFINPLVNNQGEVDNTLKSFDLSSSLTIFAGMAFNYNNLKETENTVEALKEILAIKGVVQTTADGDIVSLAGQPEREKSKRSKEYELLETLTNFHLYGAFYKEAPGKAMTALLKLKKYQQLKELALSPIASAVNLMGARSNAAFEGVKGYFYTREMWVKSLQDRFKDKEKYFALAHFLQPYQGKNVKDLAKNVSIHKGITSKGNQIAKNLNYDSLFVGFRMGDEHIDEQVMYSMLQNYGIVEGKLKRFTKADREANKFKSLADSASIDSEGNLIIEGLIDASGKTNEEIYRELRNVILNTTMSIKGGLNNEDMAAVNLTTAGQMFMTFRNWLPALAEERFRGIDKAWSNTQSSLRYNPQINTITEGRYTAFISNMSTEDKSIMNLIRVVSINTFKLTADVVTFGGFFGKVNALTYKVNEDRARQQYETFLTNNKELPAVKNGSLTFEDFLDYKKGQIKALSVEIQYMLSIVLLLMAMSGGFDDDDKDKFYKKNLATRTLYRVLNRYRRELMGIVNPFDWISLFRNPVPLMSLGNEVLTTLNNTLDEGMDIVTGEAEDRSLIKPLGKKNIKDRTERFSKTFGWIPGYKAFKWLEIFEEDKKSKY
jgi:hypothetical protein